MYLFTRTVQLAGPLRDVMGWAGEITANVNSHGGSHVSLWHSTYGQPVGRFAWSMWADSMADVQSLFMTLMADEGYHDVLAKGRDYLAAPAEDELRQLVHGTPPDATPPAGAVTVRTSATIANGQYVEAMAWGAEMSAHVESVTGQRSFFFLDSFGPFGQVTWFTLSADIATAEAATNAINADADYLGRLADVGTLFLPGSGHRAMATKIV
jgi:hypothetical protein